MPVEDDECTLAAAAGAVAAAAAADDDDDDDDDATFTPSQQHWRVSPLRSVSAVFTAHDHVHGDNRTRYVAKKLVP